MGTFPYESVRAALASMRDLTDLPMSGHMQPLRGRLRHMRMPRFMRVSIAVIGCGLLPACSADSADMTVTVVKGIEIAPPEMQRAEKPVARYLPNSNLVVFVSAPLYSGSCPPSAEAKTKDDDGLALVIDDASEGNCTADANRNTFLIQGFDEEPTRLTVEYGDGDSIEFDLGT
ncbi:hypothetical protein NOCA2420003 [metagenome]|uniref:Uncharacterized protein n=1 Tax=metagenome TaxID=256318 RepID=A0A2P2C600_9ZZZZ